MTQPVDYLRIHRACFRAEREITRAFGVGGMDILRQQSEDGKWLADNLAVAYRALNVAGSTAFSMAPEKLSLRDRVKNRLRLIATRCTRKD